MTRYADPRRCPDCAHDIEYAAEACPSCGLPLRGPVAQQLFATLSQADTLLTTLRASAAVPVGAPAGQVSGGTAQVGLAQVSRATLPPGQASTATGAGFPTGPAFPMTPLPHAPAARHTLSAASVPKILLGLGAACLLIAALVFLAVTWSVMGVGGRTATLLGFTAVTGGLAAWMARRDLRGAAEALSLVSLGLLTLDTFGARSADWLGDISTPTFLVVLGVLLALTAAAAALGARRTPAGDLVGAQLVAGAGVVLVGLGVATHDGLARSLAAILAVVVAGGAAYLARRLTLRFTMALSAAAAGVFWWAQLTRALDAVTPPTLQGMWVDLGAWQVLVSAALAGSVVALRELPESVRVGAASLAYGVLTLTAVLPALDESVTSALLVTLAALVAAGLVGWFLPRPWGLTAVLTQAVAGLATLVAFALIGGLALTRLVEAASAHWTGATGGQLGSVSPDLPAPWLAPLCVLALLGTGLVLAKASSVADRAISAVTDLRAAVALLVISAVATLSSYPVPVWTVVVLLLAAAAGFLGWWWVRQSAVQLALSAVFLAGAVALGWYDEWLTVISLAGLLLMAGAVHLRARQTDTSAVAGALAAVALAGSVWTWGALVEASAPAVALAGLVLLAAKVLTLSVYPDEWWGCDAPVTARAGVEVGAAVAALPLGLAGVLLAEADTAATWTAVNLTVAGAAVTALSLIREDRRALAWVGGALLALASWVRLWDIGVREPEAYTLPTALVLLTLGLLHLRRHPDANTMTALAPGLGLALVPSLLWVLADPIELRALLLGVACLGLVLAGVQLRWTAPLTLGALVGGAEVVRLAAPYIGEAVPRWVLIGATGAVLILMGVTWERRLREARQVMGYVRSLR
ncbi:MAG: SCO7613 C-terminal domain-containing membrane protein [Nocardioides sp.]